MIKRLCLLLCLVNVSTADDGPDRSAAEEQTSPLDVLVVAPHPDDEVLGCAGVIMNAIAQEKRVGVVILTNGDGYPRAASVLLKKPREELTPEDFVKLASIRQRQSLAGISRLGLAKDSLAFLGYPDSMLGEIYRSQQRGPFRQKFTTKDHTYSTVGTDYHTTLFGQPAPYTKAAIIDDLAHIIRRRRPKEIYVTHEVDKHLDHKAAWWFACDAADQVGFSGNLYAYVVHGRDEPELPLHRVELTPETVEKKKAAIREHQIPTVHDSLILHARQEELFWLRQSADPRVPTR